MKRTDHRRWREKQPCKMVPFSRLSLFVLLESGRCVCAWALLVLFLSAGCSSQDRVAISGTVSLDGKPLESGTISFRPVKGTGGCSAGGQIHKGQFLISEKDGLPPGKYAATVQAFRLTGRTVKDPQCGDVQEMIPVKYKEAGKLEATVDRGGTGRLDFQLTTN